ncbi:MAG: LysM domain-containing protein [Xanthobacteraceae bacterium]
MAHPKYIVVLLIAAVCFASAGEAATPLDPPSAAGKVTVNGRGRAYLFRGLIGMIDWGMDQLAQRIDNGGVAANINGYSTWRAVASQAISDYRREPEPITVIGHSIGGDSAVQFAEALGAAHIPVSLLITYDPTRMAASVPANVERYINLYQSSNILGGGDLTPGRGFHGNYASFNLKDRPEVVHINLDKFDRIQEQLAAKIKALAATPAHGEGEAVPLRIVIPPAVTIDLWDSGMPVSAHAGDTLQTVATTYHVPVWALAQVNKIADHATLTEGQRIVVPRYLVPRR